jgi:hypothetical protein
VERSVHDNAAETALDAIYELQGVEATYTPDGGVASTVQLLIEHRSRSSQDKASSRNRVHVLRAMVRVSQVEELGRGDTFQLTGESTVFKVLPSSVSNDGLEWDFEANGEVTTTLGQVSAIPDR